MRVHQVLSGRSVSRAVSSGQLKGIAWEQQGNSKGTAGAVLVVVIGENYR